MRAVSARPGHPPNPVTSPHKPGDPGRPGVSPASSLGPAVAGGERPGPKAPRSGWDDSRTAAEPGDLRGPSPRAPGLQVALRCADAGSARASPPPSRRASPGAPGREQGGDPV